VRAWRSCGDGPTGGNGEQQCLPAWTRRPGVDRSSNLQHEAFDLRPGMEQRGRGEGECAPARLTAEATAPPWWIVHGLVNRFGSVVKVRGAE